MKYLMKIIEMQFFWDKIVLLDLEMWNIDWYFQKMNFYKSTFVSSHNFF